MNRVREFIDRYEHGPLVAAILIIEIPVVVAMVLAVGWAWALCVVLAAVLLIFWVCFVMAALTRWFER